MAIAETMVEQAAVYSRRREADAARAEKFFQHASRVAMRREAAIVKVHDIAQLARIKATVNPATVADATWAGDLARIPETAAFLNLLRPQTIIGRVPGFRRVPFFTRVSTQNVGALTGWVKGGQWKLVQKLGFTPIVQIYPRVHAAIVPITKDLATMSGGAATTLVRNDLIAGAAEFTDQQFLDPSVTEVPDVSPASITSAAPSHASTGFPDSDLRLLTGLMLNQLKTLQGVVIIMGDATALAAATLMTSGGGGPLFPGLGVGGGSVWGVPVFVSSVVGENIIGIHAPSILIAEGDDVAVEASDQTTLQMDDDPSSGPQNVVSMWQTNSVALKLARAINWLVGREGAVRYITGADYGSGLS